MLWTLFLGILAVLFRTATAQGANAIVRDPDTGLTFTSNFALYKADGRGITYRIAIPENVPSYTAYDAVIQMVVPNDVGWAGLAFGGSMPRNPLLVAWRGSSNNVILSPRWANGHIEPQPYSGAQFTLFSTGTKSNSTHWQFTALCKGCTAWSTSSGGQRYLSPRGGNRMAFAYSPNRPGSSPTASLPIHDVFNYFSHDFANAANANFEATVARLTS